MSKVSLKGIIDMHVHSNPDIRQRAYNDFELMEAAIRVQARAIVLKTHQGTTMDRAFLCNLHNQLMHHGDNDFTMFGSVTLNKQVGGINPYAVESGLKLGAKVIWLPTQSARNHKEKLNQSTNDCVEVINDNQIAPELKDVFRLIKDHNAVLGTGHISPLECLRVTEAARDAGVKKIVITHPEWWLVGMSLDDQVRLVKDYDVILEHCFAQPLGGGKYKSNLAMNLEAIQTCGYKNVMVSTDGGQVENPNWEIAMEEYMQYLVDNGITQKELYHMTHGIQDELLDLSH
ncbi:DUF6282 family protein [Clostridium sp. E02]|uniref:DUF6282 family protein n=1 Tax=Clostridium sp. E02 TaxID=2487134 RepID=UPI000F53A84B|nr:DUF6282 family protein [Clostridium sp. E02]